jgi:hypothetical protein
VVGINGEYTNDIDEIVLTKKTHMSVNIWYINIYENDEVNHNYLLDSLLFSDVSSVFTEYNEAPNCI